MHHFYRSLGLLTCSALLASSCARPMASNSSTVPMTSPQTQAVQAPVSPSLPSSKHQIQSIVECPTGGTVIPKPTAPIQPFTAIQKLPTGTSIHLDFQARDVKKNGQLPSADKIYFQDGVPFEVQFVEGSAFSVTDADGTDGLVVVQLPKGVYDSYVSTKGEPGGSLGISDPLYFQKQTWASSTGKDSWAHVGVRQFPLPTAYGLGDYRLTFEPKNVTSFSTRWFLLPDAGATQPPLPPMPPAIASLSGPDTVGPGETAALQATVTDANQDLLTYRWTTTLPTGEVAPGNPVGDATATWTAPRPSGTYQISLSVEDPYYATIVCNPLTITVPNVCPVPTLTGYPAADLAPGATVSLGATGTDANGDTLTWRWEAKAGSLSTPTGAETTWTAPKAGGEYKVTVFANDGHGCEAPAEVTLKVKNLCPVPTLGASGGGALPTNLTSGQSVSLVGSSTDENGDSVSWRWEADGGSLGATTGTSTTWTAPTSAGTYTVTGFADDGHACNSPVQHSFTVTAPQPTPAPTLAPTPAPTPTTYGPGTKVQRGLYASVGTAFVFQEYDLSGLASIPSWKALKIGYFVPQITYAYVYEKDNNNQTVGFSWNYKTYGNYLSIPKATSYISGLNIKNGTLSTDTSFTGLGEAGVTSVLLDANDVPLSENRYSFTTVPFNSGRLIAGVKLTKAVPKTLTPVRKYKCYFDDGSIGETDTYSGGMVTGRIIAVSPKGSVVMPIGARFKCGVSDNANVSADQPFTPIKPPAIKKYF